MNAVPQQTPLARELGLVPETPARRPLQGIAAAQVVDRSGCARVMPVIVVDFYREAGQK